MRAKDALGRYGEDVATRYLADTGLVVLERNWRADGPDTRPGGVDGLGCTTKSRTLAVNMAHPSDDGHRRRGVSGPTD
jgi:putative endonuclease